MQTIIVTGVGLIILAVAIMLWWKSEMRVYEEERTSETRDGKFIWKPDLSHKVIFTQLPNLTTQYEQTPILIEKTAEERAEERQEYFLAKEKRL